MFYPNKEKFIQLATKGNLIPVSCEYFSDLETPVSTFMKIQNSDYSFILESAEAGKHVGRYSFLGSDPSLIFTSKKDAIKIEVKDDGKFASCGGFKNKEYKLDKNKNPLDELNNILSKFKLVQDPGHGLPRFSGGFVGYIGYDMIDFFEPIKPFRNQDLDLPDCVMMLVDNLVIFDHLTKKIKLVCNTYADDSDSNNLGLIYDNAVKRLQDMMDKISVSLDDFIDLSSASLKRGVEIDANIESNFKKEDFIDKVEKIKHEIKDGQIIQAVLSQRFSIPFKDKDPLTVYRILRAINPSPYMFFLKLRDMKLVGSSPEVMVRSEDRNVELRPIAGTRPRGSDDAEDLKLEKELINDEKERSEHIMLVDLGRNDLGRVCEYTSVKVPELMIIEKYSHVLHIVSSVMGKLRSDQNIFDLFKACFPAGTVTGAPKVKAMQIIQDMEETKRGPYAGCVGYFSFSGNMDTCITIRTILFKEDISYIQAGAGIVVDSIPEKEYEETLNKAKALIKALQIVNDI